MIQQERRLSASSTSCNKVSLFVDVRSSLVSWSPSGVKQLKGADRGSRRVLRDGSTKGGVIVVVIIMSRYECKKVDL